jgi:hypothetical protein
MTVFRAYVIFFYVRGSVGAFPQKVNILLSLCSPKMSQHPLHWTQRKLRLLPKLCRIGVKNRQKSPCSPKIQPFKGRIYRFPLEGIRIYTPVIRSYTVRIRSYAAFIRFYAGFAG